MPAVARAPYHHAIGVQFRLGSDPVQQRTDVLVGVLPEPAIVQLQEGLAVPGRPADVWIEQGDPQLVEPVVLPRQEMRAGLALRTAVDVHGDWALAGEACGRTVQESGKRSPVEALPADQLRLGKGRGVQAARLAVRPALDGARGDV